MEHLRDQVRIAGISAAAIVVAALFAFAAPAPARAGASDNVSGWAWAAEAGWMSMNATNCLDLNRDVDPDPCELAGNDYGVTIAADGRITGYAWSRSAGWICVGATCTGSGGAVPMGGWQARVNAISGQLTGWAKAVSLGDGGWISFSCENGGTCGTVAYRTTVNPATGIVGGAGWNGARDGARAASAIGWVSWAPQFGGVTTTWRPEPLCSVSSQSCRADIECRLPGESCCLGGAPCGRCGGNGVACASNAACDAGVICCREGQQCGQCVGDGLACGADAACAGQGRDSCCPPGAVCTGGRTEGGGCDNSGTCTAGETAANCPLDCGGPGGGGSSCDNDGVCEVEESVVNCASDCGGGGGGGTCNGNRTCEVGESVVNCASDCGSVDGGQSTVIGVCSGGDPTLCVDDTQCGGRSCALDLGICSTTGSACAGAADCTGSGNTCATDVGIRTDGTGVSPPCANDDPTCRRIIGQCMGAAQLCAVDANCADGSACGKLFLPWVQTQSGSIYSGGRIGSPQTPPPPSGQYNASFCILAGGPIINFLSKPGPEGCREVRRTPYPSNGGAFSLPKFPSYVGSVARIDVNGILGGRYGVPQTELPTAAELASGFVLGGKVYRYSGAGDLHIGAEGSTVTFLNGVGLASGAGLIVVRGADLILEGDMAYGGGRVTDVRHLASPGWLVLKDRVRDSRGDLVEVGGNIIIHPRVRRIVGAFYAEGEIRTGSTGRAVGEQSLIVTGVMVARKFLFERLYASATPAEQIVADGRVIANPPPGFGDLAKSLPTISQTVP